jgi:hypothetical protein
MNVLFGSSTHLLKQLPADLMAREALLYGGLIFLMF